MRMINWGRKTMQVRNEHIYLVLPGVFSALPLYHPMQLSTKEGAATEIAPEQVPLMTGAAWACVVIIAVPAKARPIASFPFIFRKTYRR